MWISWMAGKITEPIDSTIDATPDTMRVVVVSDETRMTPTPTMTRCAVGEIGQGDICFYVHTPTPYPPCPPQVSGPCVYDGPKSLVPRDTPTPLPYAGGTNGIGGINPRANS